MLVEGRRIFFFLRITTTVEIEAQQEIISSKGSLYGTSSRIVEKGVEF